MSRRLSILGAMLGLSAALSANAALAQSCAMCYTSASAASEGGIAALRYGILILLCPPLLIFAGIIMAARRKDARGRNDHASPNSNSKL